MKKKIIYLLAIISTLVYVIWRIGWSLPFGHRIIDIVFAILLLVAELIGFWEATNYFSGMTKTKREERPVIPASEYPHVDVFIATYNEETELLKKTVNGCLHMDYPDKSKVHIYICDDNDRQEMRELAESMGVGYFRRDDHRGAKAGNLNNALSHTNSPLVATFDADMIPMHGFLMAVVPYFFLDRYEKKDGKWVQREKPGNKIGFVQTPQSFYNADLFQYNLYSERTVPNEQNFFFQAIQCGRNDANAVIYAGSNTILAREALEEIGGFYENAITEDLATGLCIQTAGYQSMALDEVQANGLAPNDIKSLLKQRERWARGCIQTFRQLHLFTRKGMTGKQRSLYISSLLYWYTPIRRVIFLCAPLLFSVFNIYFLDCTLKEIVCIWLPHYIFYSMALKTLSGKQRTGRLSNIYDTILAFYLVPGVILETFGIEKTKFEVTKKSKKREADGKKEIFKIALPYIILVLLSVIGFVIGIQRTLTYRTAGFVVILFWIATNFYNLCMALFFIIGRKHQREAERYYVSVPALILTEQTKYRVMTKDISETGFSFEEEKPIYVPYEDELDIGLSSGNGRYIARLRGKLVHVIKVNNKWRYSFAFAELDEEAKLNLYQIVYDREPTLPQEVSARSGFYEDFKKNIFQRNEGIIHSHRELPRVRINKIFQSNRDYEVVVLDFNYECILVKSQMGIYDNEMELSCDEMQGLSFQCMLEKKIQGKEDKTKVAALYRLKNKEDFMYNSEFVELLCKWSGENDEREAKTAKQLKMRQRVSPYEFKEEEFL